MITILLVVAAVAVAAPVVCLVLVSIASMREDHAHSLGYRPAGVMQAAARRMLGFHGDASSGQSGDARRIGFPAGHDFTSNDGSPDDSAPDGRPDLRHLVG